MGKKEILDKLYNIIVAIYRKQYQIDKINNMDIGSGVTFSTVCGSLLVNPLFGIALGLHKGFGNFDEIKEEQAKIPQLEEEIESLISSAITLSKLIYSVDDYSAMILAITDVQQAYKEEMFDPDSTKILSSFVTVPEACNTVLAILPNYIKKEEKPDKLIRDR